MIVVNFAWFGVCWCHCLVFCVGYAYPLWVNYWLTFGCLTWIDLLCLLAEGITFVDIVCVGFWILIWFATLLYGLLLAYLVPLVILLLAATWLSIWVYCFGGFILYYLLGDFDLICDLLCDWGLVWSAVAGFVWLAFYDWFYVVLFRLYFVSWFVLLVWWFLAFHAVCLMLVICLLNVWVYYDVLTVYCCTLLLNVVWRDCLRPLFMCFVLWLICYFNFGLVIVVFVYLLVLIVSYLVFLVGIVD